MSDYRANDKMTRDMGPEPRFEATKWLLWWVAVLSAGLFVAVGGNTLSRRPKFVLPETFDPSADFDTTLAAGIAAAAALPPEGSRPVVLIVLAVLAVATALWALIVVQKQPWVVGVLTPMLILSTTGFLFYLSLVMHIHLPKGLGVLWLFALLHFGSPLTRSLLWWWWFRMPWVPARRY